LSSNGRPSVVRVFTESWPSNGYIRHSIIVYYPSIYLWVSRIVSPFEVLQSKFYTDGLPLRSACSPISSLFKVAQSVYCRVSRQGQEFYFYFTVSRRALRPIQPLSSGYRGFFPGDKAAGAPDHSPPSSGEVKNGGAIRSLLHTSLWRGAELNTEATLPFTSFDYDVSMETVTPVNVEHLVH
jgi:hypothetical protein